MLPDSALNPTPQTLNPKPDGVEEFEVSGLGSGLWGFEYFGSFGFTFCCRLVRDTWFGVRSPEP